MAHLKDILKFCDERVQRLHVTDFPGAENGLQFQNNGNITRIGAAVDASLGVFKQAVDKGVDFLIVHHGMYWDGAKPVVGAQYEKTKLLFENNIAVYGSHLPLDAHKEIGNNAQIAKHLGLKIVDGFAEYEGVDIGVIVENSNERAQLAQSLHKLFPKTYKAIEFGSKKPNKIAICSGSGASAIPFLKNKGVDTFITGELKQQHYVVAQEENLNLYVCGHYATEVFGVQELAKEVAKEFSLSWDFLPEDCLL